MQNFLRFVLYIFYEFYLYNEIQLSEFTFELFHGLVSDNQVHSFNLNDPIFDHGQGMIIYNVLLFYLSDLLLLIRFNFIYLVIP